VDEQLQHLLDAVWEHDLPLGPFGDLDIRQRAEQEWEESLTVDDCLALLGWVERPQLPPHWPPDRERWLPGLVDRAVWYASRRVGDSRVTCRFVELLAQPEHRSAALEGLVELAVPVAYDTLLCCLGDRAHRFNLCIILAASATPEQIERLRHLAWSAPTVELREAAVEVVAEWEAVRHEQRIESGVARDRDIDGRPPEHSTFSAWRTDTTVALARQMYESRDFSAMPILADALQDAGCDNEAVLHHCRTLGPHVCGCWVVDLVLGKE
jgi:hypothetical protein